MPRLPVPSPTSSVESFARFSTELWDSYDPFYLFWIERWRRVMDYLRTQHWRILQELDLKQIPGWRRFPVTNITLSFYMDYLTQWLQSRVRFSATPDQPDPSQIAGSELADGVLAYFWDKLELENKRSDLGAWLLGTGNADLRVFWNADTGNMVPLALPEKDPQGQPTGKLIPINPETLKPDPSMSEPIMVDEGEVGLEVISPQLVRHPVVHAHGVMMGNLLGYDDVFSKYGEDVAKTISYSKPQGSLATNLLSTAASPTTSNQEEKALVIEHYLPRSSRFPKGLWWTAAGRKLVTKPLPLPARVPPIIHFRWVPFPGHPYLGLTPLLDVTYLNKTYDEMRARTLEWLGKVVPKALFPTGGGLKQGDLNEEPFQELIVQPGAEPSFPIPPQPPQAFERVRQETMEDAQLVGGYKFQRQQQSPPGTGTNRFRQPKESLNQTQNVQLAIINSKASWEAVGYVLLDYVAKFYTDPRVISIVGPDRTYQWREFQGSDLTNLKASIHVDELPLYTWDRQSMRDTVISLLGTPAAGAFFAGPDGQPDRERIDAAMNAAGLDRDIATLDPDVLEARNEINAFRSLQEGEQPPQLMPWQNSETHLAEKSRLVKTMSFKGWPQPNAQALIQNMQEHEQKIAQAKQQEQQQMIDQEKQLRDVRAQSEVSQAVKIKLGEDLITALIQMIAPEANTKAPKGGKK